MTKNTTGPEAVRKYRATVPGNRENSRVTVREDGGLIDIEQDGEIIELSPAMVIELRRALYDSVTES